MSAVSVTQARDAHWLRLFLPFAAGYYISYLMRNANAVLAPELTRDLQLGASELGLLTSAYFLAFGAFQIPLGLLLDRFGPRRVQSALMLFAAAGALLFGVGESIQMLTLGRSLIGLGVSACLMAGLKNFSQWYPAERQASLSGAIMIAGGLGAMSASVPLELLMPLIGWRQMFMWLAAAIVIVAIYVFVAVPDRVANTKPISVSDQWQGVLHVFGSRAFWRYAPLMALCSGGSMAIQGLWVIPWFMSVDALNREAAAQNLFLMGVASLTSYFAIAFLATRMIRRGIRPTLIIGAMLLTACGALALNILHAGPTVLLWMVFSFCSAATTLGYSALGPHFPAELFGRVSTAANLLAFAGAFVLQWGIGVAVDVLRAVGASQSNALRAAFACVATLQFMAWIWFVIEKAQNRSPTT